MRYKVQNEWLLIAIDAKYHLKTIGEWLDEMGIDELEKQEYISTGKILLNSKRVDETIIMQKGDTLQIKAFNEEEPNLIPQPMQLKIAYEDEFFLVVDKPRNILTYPDSNTQTDTLANGVAYYYQEKGFKRKVIKPFHQLEYEVCGLVIFVKTAFIMPLIDKMLRERKIENYYYVFVVGEILEDGQVKAPIGKDRKYPNRFRVDKEGKFAITKYKVVRNQRGFTLLECKMEAERAHQIRVHMQYIRHSVVSDELYGEKYDFIEMGLQEYKIEMIHPITQLPFRVQIPGVF